MAEGFLKSFDPGLWVYSAGTKPAERVNPLAVKAMSEIGISLGNTPPRHVDAYAGEAFDYVITVCDDAKESCPVFHGKVAHRLHFGFEDPAKATGSAEQILSEFRRVRDEIEEKFRAFYASQLSGRS